METKLNLEKTVEFLSKCGLQGVRIKYKTSAETGMEKILAIGEIGDFVYYEGEETSSFDDGLYVITDIFHDENDHVKGFLYLGEFPARGEQGLPGQIGNTPVIEIIDGYWYVDGESTGVKASVKGDRGPIGMTGPRGLGISTMVSFISNMEPTSTDKGDYYLVETYANITYEGQSGQETYTVPFKYTVPKNAPTAEDVLLTTTGTSVQENIIRLDERVDDILALIPVSERICMMRVYNGSYIGDKDNSNYCSPGIYICPFESSDAGVNFRFNGRKGNNPENDWHDYNFTFNHTVAFVLTKPGRGGAYGFSGYSRLWIAHIAPGSLSFGTDVYVVRNSDNLTVKATGMSGARTVIYLSDTYYGDPNH